MSRFVVRRILLALLVLAGVSVISFSIIHLTPGDPAELLLGSSSDTRGLDRLREEMGLNRPLPVQYLRFVQNAFHGLGKSHWTHQNVGSMIAERLPTTMALTTFSMLLMIAMAIPAGVIAAVRRQTIVDYGLLVLALIGNSTPAFWMGLLMIWFFAGYLGILPASGTVSIEEAGLLEYFKHLVMPSFALAFWMAALVSRLTRSALLEELAEDYVRTARAKGLPKGAVIYRHALRNAMLPVITVIGLYFGTLIGGAVVTETVFSLPGIGRMAVQAILVKDFAVVQGVLLFTALILVLVNLLVDLSYAFLDPRIRYG